MNPEIIGGHWWEVIHSSAASAKTQEQRTEFERFMYKTIPTLFPCEYCRTHINSHMAKYPIKEYMGSNEQLLLWSYLVHESVNQSLGKKGIPYADVKRRYIPSGDMICTTVCSEEEEKVPTKKKSHNNNTTTKFSLKSN
jgi:hypothetical protein